MNKQSKQNSNATSKAAPEKIELYNEGEYCEDVQDGKTCIDRFSNCPCSPCMQRVQNMNVK